jgi:hypothetical protein
MRSFTSLDLFHATPAPFCCTNTTKLTPCLMVGKKISDYRTIVPPRKVFFSGGTYPRLMVEKRNRTFFLCHTAHKNSDFSHFPTYIRTTYLCTYHTTRCTIPSVILPIKDSSTPVASTHFRAMSSYVPSLQIDCIVAAAVGHSVFCTFGELLEDDDHPLVRRSSARKRTRRSVQEIFDCLGPAYFRRAYRMTYESFRVLHGKIGNLIRKFVAQGVCGHKGKRTRMHLRRRQTQQPTRR